MGPNALQSTDIPDGSGISGNYFQGTNGADTDSLSTSADIAWGNGGNDTFTGRGGNDTFYGGLGNDVLTGGGGSDSFMYSLAANEGSDTIVDFNTAQGDKLGFANITLAELISTTTLSGGNQLNLASGSAITLTGVTITDLSSWLTANAVII